MDIRIISLRESARRRASIASQFEMLPLDYGFFDAVTPRNSCGFVDGYDEAEFVLNCGRVATDGEVACYASHLELWRQCANANRPFLILEDDARLSRSFCDGLAVLEKYIVAFGLIRAALPLPRQSIPVAHHGNFTIHYCQRVPLQALGYALSPETAARLVRAGGTIEEPVDKFLQRFWRHGERVFSLLPAIVEHSPLAEISDIGDRFRDDYDVTTRLRRLLRKSANSLARTYANAVFSIE